MAAHAGKRAAEWDPKFLGFGLVGITGFAIALSHLSPRSERPEIKVRSMRLVASGKSLSELPGVDISDPRSGLPRMKVAMWAIVAHDPPDLLTEAPLGAVQVVDDGGKRWPAAINASSGYFTVLIPEGYAAVPKSLYASFDTGRRTPVRIQLPTPPPPVHESPPDYGKPWPGLVSELHQLLGQRERLEIMIKAPLPKGHVLVAQELGSSSTLHENSLRESSFLMALAGGPVHQLIRVHYPETTPTVYMRVRELAPVKCHARVRIGNCTPRYQYGEWWLADLERVVTLADGTRLSISAADRRLYRAPKHRRKDIRLLLVATGTATVNRAVIVSPTHFGGVPIKFWNSEPASDAKRVDYQGGSTDIVFDVEYSVYKSVREATVPVSTMNPLPPMADGFRSVMGV